MKHAWIGLVVLGIAACAQFPDVDGATKNDMSATSFPDLVPLESIARPDTARLDENSEAQLESRADGLKRRANKLWKYPTE